MLRLLLALAVVGPAVWCRECITLEEVRQADGCTAVHLVGLQKQFGDAGAVELAKAGMLSSPSLRSVRLVACGLTSVGASAITEAIQARSEGLDWLDLSHNNITGLAGSIQHVGLPVARLDLRSNALSAATPAGNDGCSSTLTLVVGSPALRHLSLRDNDISDEHGSGLGNALHGSSLQGLQSLDLSENARVGAGTVSAIFSTAAGAPRSDSLRHLELSDCPLLGADNSAFTFETIGKALEEEGSGGLFPGLQTLVLSGNELRAESDDEVSAVRLFAKGVGNHRKLAELQLFENALSDVAAACLADCLVANLSALDLSDNAIHDKGAMAMEVALNSVVGLGRPVKLDLSGNKLTVATRRRIDALVAAAKRAGHGGNKPRPAQHQPSRAAAERRPTSSDRGTCESRGAALWEFLWVSAATTTGSVNPNVAFRITVPIESQLRSLHLFHPLDESCYTLATFLNSAMVALKRDPPSSGIEIYSPAFGEWALLEHVWQLQPFSRLRSAQGIKMQPP